MEFDWTTFALEILNFLVLVWVLQRFFYQPVLAVIEARRAESQKIITDAEALRGEAERLKGQYQAHLAEVDKDRAAAKARLDEEIAAERTRRLAALEAEMAAERQRREALAARERSELELALEQQAVGIAARFTTRLLERLAGPELEAKLVDLTLGELDTQAPEQPDGLSAALRNPGVTVKVVTAYPLDEVRRAAFSHTLGRLAGQIVAPKFAEDAMLKAGCCIMVGSWVLMANLRDELNFFAEAFDHGG